MTDYRKTPLWDNSLTLEERLDYLVGELTLEEKLQCLTTGCPDVERLGIKASFMGGEAAHGIEARHDQAFNAGEPEPTTAFTQPFGMSMSWDRELIRECGRCVGEEARALFTRNGGGGLCRWAPTIDMERDPRWGRTEEAYGEDPLLTGEMASAYIQGMKGDHPFYLQCGATLKHFYANNVEKDRISISSSLDGRNKHEYYLEPFRRAVQGGAEAVMTSYNEINGIPALVNPEVQKLLKDEWGLPGHVVCDGADMQQTVNDHKFYLTHAETIAGGLKAGLDCFTDDKDVIREAGREAYEKGLITMEDIDRSVRNSFRTRIRLGFFDGSGDCPYTGMGEEYVNSEDHRQVCARMAASSCVLLKNEENTLPIRPEETESIAVVGPLADVWYKDWYCGIPPYSVTVEEGIASAYSNAEVSCENGLSQIRLLSGGRYVGLDGEGRLYLTDEAHGETFVFTDWGCGSMTLRAKSCGKLVTLDGDTMKIAAASKEAFGWFVRESWSFEDCGEGKKLLVSWNGRRVAVDKDGYLAVIRTGGPAQGETAFPEPVQGKPVSPGHEGEEAFWLREGEPAVFTVEVVRDGTAEAVKAAKAAGRTVLVLGSNPVINSKEEIDRTTLALPPAQQKLADAVLDAAPDAVIVLVTNYPYTIDSLQKRAKAILLSASGSQELGNGIAAVLSGRISPAGRLNMTWYLSDEDLPDMSDYDIIKGKRTYQYFDREVLYPFGFGLSYTEFAYGPMEASRQGDEIRVKASVTNTGGCAGDEVVQLYVHKEGSRVVRPISQLKGFCRVKALAPGETREVEFVVPCADLAYYDVISGRLLVEGGDYQLLLGASSRDIRQSVTLTLEGEQAGYRDLYQTTEAAAYDDYENCFLHKGIGNTTCVIPGRAGDAPNEVKEGERPECCLIYRDAAFASDKMPSAIRLTLNALQEGEITLSLERADGQRAGTPCKLAIPAGSGFTEVKEALPEGFLPAQREEESVYTLRICVKGKIKLNSFRFV